MLMTDFMFILKYGMSINEKKKEELDPGKIICLFTRDL